MRRALPASTALVLLLSGLLACGVEGEQAALDASASADGEGSSADGSASVAADDSAAIDPAVMPSPGTIVVDIDGTSVTFSETDATGDFQCELADDRVELRFESTDTVLGAEFMDGAAIGGEAGVFDGNATVVLPEFDLGGGERYSSAGSDGVQVLIEPPYALITARFTYRESSTDTSSDDVGTATIAATCGEDGEKAGSGTAGVSGSADDAGTPDSDGHAASIRLSSTTYDFGALAADVTCAAAYGIYRGSARTEAQGGGTLGFEAVIYAEDSPAADAAEDPPYVRIIDDGADLDLVAGPVPGDSSVDPGASRVVDVVVTDSEATATLELVDTRTGEATTGTLVASCPR